MKKILLVLIVVAFGLAGLKTVLAGDATVIIRDVSIWSGQSGKLEIVVYPDVPVAGIQFEIAFQTDQVTVRENIYWCSTPTSFSINTKCSF